jgi:hypothetical protein
VSFQTESGLGELFSAMAIDRTGFNAAGNHPMAAQKWNHDLAGTAIGWS